MAKLLRQAGKENKDNEKTIYYNENIILKNWIEDKEIIKILQEIYITDEII